MLVTIKAVLRKLSARTKKLSVLMFAKRSLTKSLLSPDRLTENSFALMFALWVFKNSLPTP